MWEKFHPPDFFIEITTKQKTLAKCIIQKPCRKKYTRLTTILISPLSASIAPSPSPQERIEHLSKLYAK